MSKQPKKAAKKTAKKAAKKAAPKKTAKKAVELGDPNDSLEKIEFIVSSMKEELDEFNFGNKSAGRRLRKLAQEIRQACGLLRKEIQNKISNM